MHIKHIHETIEKLSQYACEEACKNKEAIDTQELKEVVEMVEKLAKAEYYARIAKAMEEADKEEEEDIKYIMKKMKEDGEDWNEGDARRFYRGQPRSKTSGRFMSRGDSRRSRGYEEPMYYDPMEYLRDFDRGQGRMYYSGSSSSNMSENTRGYSDGYNDGQTRGYSEGYEKGRNEGERNGRRNESRSERARRNYTDTKQIHKGNTEEDKNAKMKSLEEYMKDLGADITELIGDMDNSEKTMLRSKLQTLATKVQ